MVLYLVLHKRLRCEITFSIKIKIGKKAELKMREADKKIAVINPYTLKLFYL